MKRAFGGVLLLAMGFPVGLGACVGEGALVGTNHAGSGGSAGSGGGAGSGGATVPRSGPVRTTYYVSWMGRGITDPSICSRPLGVDDAGRATAKVFAMQEESPSVPARVTSCDCTEPGRAPLEQPAREVAVDLMTRYLYCDPNGEFGFVDCDDVCVCEVLQADGAALHDCQYNVATAPETTGWCYVSPAQGVGSDANVAECLADTYSRLRFLGDAEPRSEAFLLATHHAAELPEREAPADAPLGAPCLPEDELSLDFPGYSETEASVVTGTPECDSGVCVVNHLRGRVSCPYGQTEEEAESAPQCFQPGSDLAVTTPVPPQLLGRAAASTAICSCRCDGPGPGDFCECPSDMECAPLIGDLGLSGSEALAGSYCIARGTAYDPVIPYSDRCNTDLANCGDPRPF